MRLRDVAEVAVGPAEERVIARFRGEPSVNMGLVKQATGNPLELSRALRAEVDKINETLPEGMRINIAYDSSVFIDRSIESVFKTIGEAVILVVLVIFFFLRNLRATLIPLVTIPLSLVGSFALMYVFGFTINTLTLLAMVLAIGLVVDDAIVVLENIYRNIEEGMDRVAASIKGIKEIGFAVVAMTLTLTAVYAPLAFATGRTGRLFIEFALALAGAVLVSGFVALTLSPMMCSKLLKHEPKHGRLFTLIEGWLNSLTRGYSRSLAWVLDRRWVVVIAVGRRRRPRRPLLLAAALRARAAGGPRCHLRAVAVAARFDGAVHLRAVASGRELLRHHSRGVRLQRGGGFSDGGLRQRNPAAEAVGRAYAQAAGHRSRAERQVLAAAGRDWLRGQSAIARAIAALAAGRVRDHGAGVVPRAGPHRAELHRRDQQDRHRAESAVRPAARIRPS